MNLEPCRHYVFLPCRYGEHRYCRGQYKREYLTALNYEIEAGRCICMCHQVSGNSKGKSEHKHEKPAPQSANARKVRG